MADENEELPLDRPDQVPAQQSAVDPQEAEIREALKQFGERNTKEWFTEQLRNPIARQFFWDILKELGTFEEKYGFGPGGYTVNDHATWAYAGQKDFGLRLYHTWSCLDRAGVLGMLDEHHPQFPKPPAPRKRRKSRVNDG